jgi:kynureninase
MSSYDEAGGVSALRTKALRLTEYLELLIKDYENDPAMKGKVRIFTPSEPNDRGCQLSLFFTVDVSKVNAILITKGVICDVRKPSVIRVAPTPLYNSFKDVFDFVAELKAAVLQVSE